MKIHGVAAAIIITTKKFVSLLIPRCRPVFAVAHLIAKANSFSNVYSVCMRQKCFENVGQPSLNFTNSQVYKRMGIFITDGPEKRELLSFIVVRTK